MHAKRWMGAEARVAAAEGARGRIPLPLGPEMAEAGDVQLLHGPHRYSAAELG
jgi:hypothetical protein